MYYSISSTHHYKFCSKANIVLPGDTQHVGQIEREVYNATAGGCQVGTREQGTDEETLHDGNNAEGSKEKKHHAWVTVWQQASHLSVERGEKVIENEIVSWLQQYDITCFPQFDDISRQ